MKKILVISATRKTNYALAKDLAKLLSILNVEVTLLSLEDYILPLYTDNVYQDKKDDYFDVVEDLTKQFINHKGLIICGPEYNGSTAPIITNTFAWISVSTDYWKDAFLNKVFLVASSSGGLGTKFITSIKLQLEHLGSVVMSTPISVNDKTPLKEASAKKILKQFIDLI